MADPPLMKCGHTAHGIDADTGKPVCVSCLGIVAGADVIDENAPDLTGRFATCCYGNHARVPSRFGLPFFKYNRGREEDTYYCGCFGWD